jgi:hypothetical protein
MAGLHKSVLFGFGVLAYSALAFAAESRTPASAQPATTLRQSMAKPFSNQVVQQLLNPPETSRKTLDQAARGQVPASPKEAKFALQEARSYLNGWLREEFRPSSATTFVAFAREAGRFDVIRARYHTKKCEIEVAQTQHILVLRIRGLSSRPGRSARQRIEETAHRIFLEGHRIHPKTSGADAKYEYGEQSIGEHGPIDPDWPHWIDSLLWFADHSELGFVLLKASGGPTRAVISFAEEFNVKWFQP